MTPGLLETIERDLFRERNRIFGSLWDAVKALRAVPGFLEEMKGEADPREYDEAYIQNAQFSEVAVLGVEAIALSFGSVAIAMRQYNRKWHNLLEAQEEVRNERQRLSGQKTSKHSE